MPFQPITPSEVTIYTCGPTVYQTAHLGNLRTYIFADLLRRVMEYNGYAVRHAMNITDVGHLTDDADAGEDKLKLAAERERKTAWEIAARYTQDFFEDSASLNILRPHVIAKATDHIPEQIALIQVLEAKGYTYITSDGVYFDTSKFPRYWEFAGQEQADKEAGARVEVNEEKKQPADFALWKLSPEGTRRDMEWESPWGIGFPGWHIECSAMSTKYLGQPFDIHTGGIDHIPVHHTNEIAQSEAAHEQPLANYWLHGAFMLVDGTKMSKSLGNVYTMSDLTERGHDPLAFRLMCLMTSYRKPLNFTWEALTAAERALAKLRLFARTLPKETEVPVAEQVEEEFRNRMNDDFNSASALALLWDQLKSDESAETQSALLQHADTVFGLGLTQFLGEPIEIPTDIQELVNDREKYRSNKEFEKADGMRDELNAKGYDVQDTPKGPQVVPHLGATPTQVD